MGRGGGGGQRFVSRLDAVKEAVSRHLEHMAVTEPQNKVKRPTRCPPGASFEYSASLPPSHVRLPLSHLTTRFDTMVTVVGAQTNSTAAPWMTTTPS